MKKDLILFSLFLFTSLILGENRKIYSLDNDTITKLEKLKGVIKENVKKGKDGNEENYDDYKNTVLMLGESIDEKEKEFIEKLDLKYPTGIDRQLLIMSFNIFKDQQLLTELVEYFQKTTPRGLTPPMRLFQTKRKYQYIWQYILLAPHSKIIRRVNSLHYSKGNAYYALREMNSNYSVPIIYYYLNLSLSLNIYKKEIFSFLVLLKNTPSQSSLSYILKGLQSSKNSTLIQKNSEDLGLFINVLSGGTNSRSVSKKRKWHNRLLKRFGERWLEGPYHPLPINTDYLKWKEVILAYPKGDLPQWQKEFLDDVLKAIDKQEKKDAKTTE